MSGNDATKPALRAGPAGEAYGIGYEALGPVFTSFGRIVLLRAERLGLGRLYFVARDGDLLRSVIGQIEASRGGESALEHRYLLISRRSSQLPATAELDLAAVHRIGAGQPGEPYLRRVFGALNLDPALFLSALGRHGLAAPDVTLAQALRDGRLLRLLADGEFREAWLRERSRQRGLLRQYLEQEGLFDGVPSALVDVGWRGTIQSNLEDAFGAEPGWGHPPGLYVGIWDDPVFPEPPRHLERKEGLVGDFRRGSLLRETGVHHAALLLEAVCRAPHGTVLGYAVRQGERVGPLLADGSESRVKESAADETLASLRQGILARAEDDTASVSGPADEDSARRLAQRALFRIAVFPSPEELRILGSVVHTEGFDTGWSAALVSSERVSLLRSPRRWIAGLRSPWRAGFVAATGGRVASGLYVTLDALLQKLPRHAVAAVRRAALRWTRSPDPAPERSEAGTPAPAMPPRDLARWDTVSFDVFDTILTRAVAHPTGIFDLMAPKVRGRLRGVRARIPFAKARILSEILARLFSRREEVTLDEIYGRLGLLLGLSGETLDEIRREELRLEAELSVPVDSVVRLAETFGKAGKRVLFVSDVYLPEEFVVSLLRRGGVDVSADDVFVSSRWNATKGSGSLFRLVAEKRGIRFESWLHLGDNPASDVRSPRRLGMDALLVRPPDEVPLSERRISPGPTRIRSGSANPVSEILAGTLRNRRWSSTAEIAEDPASLLGRELVGPLLLPYVLWALRETRRKGLKRVFFLARDGEILFKIAEAAERHLGTDLGLRYLLVSRQSLNLPCLGLPGSPTRWLFESNVGLTTGRLATRLDLDPGEVRALLAETGISLADPDEPLAGRDTRRLERTFAGSPLGEAAARQAARAREAALLYLEGEEAIGPEEVSLVDLGWRGTLQERLASLASAAGAATRFTGHYLGAVSRLEGPEIPRRAFLFDTRRSAWPGFAMLQTFGVMETLTRATHGTVLRYRASGESAVPELDPHETETWTAGRIHAGARAFVDAIPRSALLALFDASDEDLRRASARIALSAIFRPPADEAEFLGGMKFSGEQGETPGEELAPPLRGWHAARATLGENPFFPARKTFWLQASLVRGGSGLASPAGLALRQGAVAVGIARAVIGRALGRLTSRLRGAASGR